MQKSEVIQAGVGSAASMIDSSNIGFQLLKKHGWKEGTGLGISEQGRIEPVEAFLKNGKRGLGAEKEKIKRPAVKHSCSVPTEAKFDQGRERLYPTKSKALSKRHRKMQEYEKRLQEKEFERTFFREFWPDNV